MSSLETVLDWVIQAFGLGVIVFCLISPQTICKTKRVNALLELYLIKEVGSISSMQLNSYATYNGAKNQNPFKIMMMMGHKTHTTRL